MCILGGMNILLLLMDQLSRNALRAYGNTYDTTTHINALIEQGISFEHAYTPCPLCQPARAAFWSSSYPHQNGVVSNLPDQGFADFPDIPTLGQVFQNAGYTCVHFGKEHDYGALRGFTRYPQVQVPVKAHGDGLPLDYETYFDENTTQQAEAFLLGLADSPDIVSNSASQSSPFFAVVDLQNPHNICSYIGESQEKPAVQKSTISDSVNLPELPPNFHTPDMAYRPPFLQYQCCAHRRQSQVTQWAEGDYRHYLYAYHRYIEIVDQQVGRVIKALEASGTADNTAIVVMADHGEAMAAHGLVTKHGTFYNETNEVPLSFIVPEAAQTPSATPKRISGICSLLDVAPTLTDLCGLAVPTEWQGQSLKWALTGNEVLSNHAHSVTRNQYTVGEWYDEFAGYIVPGRVYVDNQYKYTVYRDKETAEELYSRTEDPYEQKNLVNIAEYQSTLQSYRKKLLQHCKDTNDPFYQLEAEYEDKYRQHNAGFSNHTGPNAVIDYFEAKQ